MLTPGQITRLLDLNASKRTAVGSQWFDGSQWHNGKPPHVGSFRGRAGTIRRSAKGRTRRMPDGSRKYIVPYDSTVVAYKP